MIKRIMSSIRFKLFMIFIGIIFGLQLLSIMISSNVIENLLLYSGKSELHTAMQKITSNAFYRQNQIETEGFDMLLSGIAYDLNGNFTLIDRSSGWYKTTVAMRGRQGGMMSRSEIIGTAIAESSGLRAGDVKIFKMQGRDNQGALAVFIGMLDERYLIISEKPLQLIRESSKLVNVYMFVLSLLSLAIGSIAVSIVSKHITKPIIEIERQANRISKLEFNPKNQIQQSDELGSLGRAVNEIADELELAINDLKSVNSQLKGEIEQERQMEQKRKQFVTGVSHELRTPISMIVGYADGLKHGVAKTPEQIERYCDVIMNESERMNRMITDLLDVSSLTEGNMVVRPHLINLSELVIQSVALYDDLQVNKKFTISTDIAKDITLMADPQRIEQVLRNVLGNAVKHVFEGGQIRVNLSQDNRMATIGVYNEGPPIPEEELASIWMSFFRGERARDERHDGFGIGLSVVKAIVERHSGQVEAVNEAGGVRFIIRLPLEA